jgi:hypothetical protein
MPSIFPLLTAEEFLAKFSMKLCDELIRRIILERSNAKHSTHRSSVGISTSSTVCHVKVAAVRHAASCNHEEGLELSRINFECTKSASGRKATSTTTFDD